MLINNNLKFYLLFFLSIVSSVLYSQNYLSSLYSKYAWGEMQQRSSAATLSMGSVGYSFRDHISVNSMNPASYAAFDSLTSVIDAAVSYRSHSLSENGKTQFGSTANLDYLYLGLPVTSFWSTAFGYQPFSIVNYNYVYSDASVEHCDRGTGGTYELFWGNSFELSKDFSFGIQASYLFGTGDRIHELIFKDDDYFSMRNTNGQMVRGLLLNGGVQYIKPLGNKVLGIGLTYTPSISGLIQVKQYRNTVTYRISGSNDNIIDSLEWNSGDNDLKISNIKNPTVLGLGISLAESENFFVGCDFTWSDWSEFSMGDVKDSTNDMYKIAFGGRLVPNSSSSRYLMKVTYAMGAFFERNYINVNGISMYRMGLSLGAFFPVKKNKTKIGTIFEIGTYTPFSGNAIEERYFRAIISLQLYEQWYQRRKLD